MGRNMMALSKFTASPQVFFVYACLCAPLASLAPQTVADARAGVTPLQIGERIRFQAANEVVSADCDVNVLGFAHDTVRVKPNERCLHGEFGPVEIKALFFAGEDRGARGAHFAIGFAGGAVAGAILGRIVVGNGCKPSYLSCDDAGLAVAVYTILGAALGALTGGVVGLAWPAGPAWHPIPMPPNLTISIK
jgi:hypothetical protein